MPTEHVDIAPSDDDHIDGKLVTEGSSIFRLATAQLGIIEEAPSSKFHLRFTLCCDKGDLNGAVEQYEVNLRQCLVEITTEGCDVSYSDAYSYQLSDTEVSLDYRDKTVKESTGRNEIGGGAKIKLSWRERAGIAFTGKISWERVSNELQKLEVTGKRRIMLIDFFGTHWTVGHDELGDPRHIKERLLRGRYFHEDVEKPLCTINLRTGATEGKVTVAVRAKRGQLDVRLLDRTTGRPSREAGQKHVDDWSNALRERLRGMAVAEALHERQTDVYPMLPQSEFELTHKRQYGRRFRIGYRRTFLLLLLRLKPRQSDRYEQSGRRGNHECFRRRGDQHEQSGRLGNHECFRP